MIPRILLVDDDPLVREVVGDYLSSNGYEVDLAEDAEQALALFKPGRFEAVLIDIVMPGMNGLDLMNEILVRDDKVFCLIMTGYPTIDLAYKAMVHGVTDYIIKPFQLLELLNVLQKNI